MELTLLIMFCLLKLLYIIIFAPAVCYNLKIVIHTNDNKMTELIERNYQASGIPFF